jgi:Na+/phosphate symporter
MLFNGLGVLIMIPFIGHYERLLNFIVPPQKKQIAKEAELETVKN